MHGLQHQQNSKGLHAAARYVSPRTARVLVLAAAKGSAGKKAASKGFGAPKQQEKVIKDGCPCGSGKYFKECCKPYITGSANAPTVEATVRARFSAILKKEVSYLLKTTHPDFHTFLYGTEPGGALRTLQDDLWNTVEHYEYSNLRVRGVQPGDKPNEEQAVFQYTVYDKRTPLIDDQGNKSRKVQIEQSRFVKDDDMWQFAEYKLVEVPEALAKMAELQAKDMAASRQEQQEQQAAGGGASSS